MAEAMAMKIIGGKPLIEAKLASLVSTSIAANDPKPSIFTRIDQKFVSRPCYPDY